MLVQNVSVGGGHECEFLGWLRAVNLRCDPAHAPPIPERACTASLRRAPYAMLGIPTASAIDEPPPVINFKKDGSLT
jgi:hypothetical protein